MRTLAHLRTIRNAAKSLSANRFVPAGHFYSPIPSDSDVERALRSAAAPHGDIDLREADQLQLAETLAKYTDDTCRGPRYDRSNGQFGYADGSVYAAMLQHLKPGRVLEIGSGHSSAVALDTCEAAGVDTKFTFVDPYPERLLSVLGDADQGRVTVHRKPVQDLADTEFDTLESGDILFIDSTHVAKAGSDVNHLYFHALPRLKPGVWVHIHDMPWPFEYSADWLHQGRAWNEAYLVRAFLSFNTAYRIELWGNYLETNHPGAFAPFADHASDRHAGSLWLRRI